MWNLSGDDIHRAKEELKGRRAAIKARFDSEMKQLEADIAAIETFERAAVDFVSNFKGEEAPAVPSVDPKPAGEQIAAEKIAADRESEPSSPTEDGSVKEPAELEAVSEPSASAEPVAGGKGSSRWRMRLGTP
jgi:hypothetical protein